MNLKMPVEPSWLGAQTVGRPVGVDRKGDGVLLGYVVAQEGPFKSEGRGEFDEASLRSIIKLANDAKAGLKARFTHPDMSSDGLGKFLGRSQNFAMSTAKNADGKTVKAVRADLHFDPSAHSTPSGDLAGYVMTMAESDPDALSSSLALRVEKEYRLEKDGTQTKDKEGEPLPPLWRPTELHASDIVDTGDAVDGLLSVDGLPLAQLWRGAELLDTVFAGQKREAVEARCLAYLSRYLDRSFGAPAPAGPTPRLDALRLRLDTMALDLRRCNTR